MIPTPLPSQALLFVYSLSLSLFRNCFVLDPNSELGSLKSPGPAVTRSSPLSLINRTIQSGVSQVGDRHRHSPRSEPLVSRMRWIIQTAITIRIPFLLLALLPPAETSLTGPTPLSLSVSELLVRLHKLN
jgi:hypothetical protein